MALASYLNQLDCSSTIHELSAAKERGANREIMVSQRKPKADETFFYVFWFEDSDNAFASPVDPISVSKAKECGGCRCSEEKGVCFKERGVS